MADDPYVVLGVDPDAAPDEVRRAWLELARRHHPDRGGDPAAMQRVNEAWAVVGDPGRRAAWDRANGRGAPPSPSPHAWAAGPVDDDPDVDLDADLLDDRPLVAPRRSTFELAPVGLFAASIAIGCLGLALDAPPLLGVAGFVFFLSCMAVAAVALVSMRRGVRAGHR